MIHISQSNEGVGYHLGEEEIPHDTEEKDLRVIITEDVKTASNLLQQPRKPLHS